MFIALDLETTWLDSKKDKIIEIAIIKFDEKTWEIIDSFSSLINPQIEIPDFITNLTNISNENIKNSPILDKELKEKIWAFIWDLPIVWHNIIFDINFLLSNNIDVSKNIYIDTFWLSNIVLQNQKSLNLWSLCEFFEINSWDEHRAFSDTKSSLYLFIKLQDIFLKLDTTKKETLKYIFSKSSDKNILFLKEYFFDDIIQIDSQKYIDIILKNIKKYDEKNSNQIFSDFNIELNNEYIEKIFKNNTLWEIRENQLTMSKEVLSNLINREKIIIEAPTWVWKTFAYSIPSILYSIKFWEQVFISTATKILQDQIFKKDLEFLQKELNINFSFYKLKWSANYLWVNTYINYILDNDFLDINQTILLSKINIWIFDTVYWELDEINFYPQENNIIKDINADRDIVFSKENDYFYYEYLYKARTKAQNSNIVVINHNILIQESISNFRLFWQIKNLIIDESHNLEDITTSSLLEKFSLFNLQSYFGKIKRYILTQKLFLDNIDIYFDKIYDNISLIFDILDDYTKTKNSFWNDNIEIYINNDFFINNSINNVLNNLINDFKYIFEIFTINQDKLLKIKREINCLNNIYQIINNSLINRELFIPIYSVNKNFWNTLSYTYLNVDNFLNSYLWDKIDSVILTSATLKIWDNFDYIKNNLWLKDFKELSIKSDFDYKKQSLIVCPNNLWSIKYDNPFIKEFLLDFLKIVWWNTLILTTAFTTIKNLYTHLNLELKKENIHLLAQNIWANKWKIIHFFKKSPHNSVIIWTDSFWEWIDIPWEDLKYVIMHKFPFTHPNDPIFLARSKLYKDSFNEYSLPKAILKTKQWFWRLIRTKNDTWIFIILDDRFYNSFWWEKMKLSFPEEANIKIIHSQNFLDLINKK